MNRIYREPIINVNALINFILQLFYTSKIIHSLFLLQFLGKADSIFTLSKMYLLGQSTLYKIVCEVCVQVWEILSPIYLPDKQVQDWLEIAEDLKVVGVFLIA